MRGTLVVGAAVAAVLLPAGPATTGTLPDRPPRSVASTPHLPARPAPLPPYRPAPGEGCTVPVSGPLLPCPDVRRDPPVVCVVPVGRTPGTLVTGDCPRHRPAPGGRVVPVTR